MPRPANGQVVEKTTQGGTTYALRFRAGGARRYLTLGTTSQGWTRAKAEDELTVILAQVRRGVWRPPAPQPEIAITRDPTFGEFTADWWVRKRLELAEVTAANYKNELEVHLLPFFERHRLSQITIAEVDRYKGAKLIDGELAHVTINRHLTRLGQILEDAVEYDLIARNPARGKRRRLKIAHGRPVHLDSAEHIAVLLEAADSLEARETRRRTVGRRALVATLVFAGLRAAEAGDLLWRDVDLAAARITVGRAKTNASYREVDILPVLHDELAAYKASSAHTGPDDLVFTTAGGGRRNKDNIRVWVLQPVVRRGDELLAKRDDTTPLPKGLTPHKLRHSFASILSALGHDPAYVMGQLGHTDPRFTLRVYTHRMKRGDDERERLRALIEGREWAPTGTNATETADPRNATDPPKDTKHPIDTTLKRRRSPRPPPSWQDCAPYD